MRSKFYQWMRERGCLNSFFRNRKAEGKNFEFSVNYGLIDCSFCWADTPEGHDFWSDIDFKFDCWLRDLYE